VVGARGQGLWARNWRERHVRDIVVAPEVEATLLILVSLFLPVTVTEKNSCKFTEIILYLLSADVEASIFVTLTDDAN
jgi:hypothetical protein